MNNSISHFKGLKTARKAPEALYRTPTTKQTIFNNMLTHYSKPAPKATTSLVKVTIEAPSTTQSEQV